MKFVVTVGNPFAGMRLYGPFEDSETAVYWAGVHFRNEEWYVVILNNPKDEHES